MVLETRNRPVSDSTPYNRIKTWRRHEIAMHFGVRPVFCCGCICLGAEDANRMRRVFAIVRKTIAQARGQPVGGSGLAAGAAVVADSVGQGFQRIRESVFGVSRRD
jgi:hypothetical protein